MQDVSETSDSYVICTIRLDTGVTDDTMMSGLWDLVCSCMSSLFRGDVDADISSLRGGLSRAMCTVALCIFCMLRSNGDMMKCGRD